MAAGARAGDEKGVQALALRLPWLRRAATAAVLVGAVAALVASALLPAAADARRRSHPAAKMGTSGPLPKVPRSFVGVIADDALWGTDSDPSGANTMRAIRAMGAGSVRVPFLWSRFEPAPGSFDPSLYDNFVGQAARAGLAVLPVLFDPPGHRSSRPARGARRGTYPPASNADFGRFAAALVGRYGPAGSFWSAHPELPRRPIASWQVWNEPNLRQFWPAGPDPAAYAAMLRTVGAAIHASDPRAEVVAAGLNESATGIPLSRFLRGMYRAGARGSFDSLGIHPYARNPTGVVEQLHRARQVMRAHRDRARIRVTEVGWATGGPTPAKRVSEATQARHTRQTMERLLRLRRAFRLSGVSLFNWRDAPPYPGSRDFWGLHAGLHAQDGRPKPVVQALATLLARVTSG